MKALKYIFLIAFAGFALSSCTAYSQGYYDRGGYYGNNDPYYGNSGNYGGYNDYNGYNDYDYNDGYYNAQALDYNTFHRALSPYGNWINTREYGNVWVPRVGRNFHPYGTNGYWVMTDYGNTWVSDYSWGWAPFHYGRWFYDNYYGWAWIPGYEWAPAWVTWRSGGGYYGWAPLGPHMSINVSINIPSISWIFVSDRYMYNRNIHRYYDRYSPRIYNRTTIINNTYVFKNNRYYSGPNANDHYRSTGNRVNVYRLSSGRTPGRSSVSDRTVNIYNPQITRSQSSGREASQGRSTINDRSSSTGRQIDNSRSSGQVYDRGRSEQGNMNQRGYTPYTRESNTGSVSRSTTTRERGNIDSNSSSRSRSEGRIDENAPTRSTDTRSTYPVQRREMNTSRTETRESAPARQREYTPSRRESTPVQQQSTRSSSSESRNRSYESSSRSYDRSQVSRSSESSRGSQVETRSSSSSGRSSSERSSEDRSTRGR